MSDHPTLKSFHCPTGPTYQSSSNAGAWQANTGQPLSGQQSYESWAAYSSRQSAYESAKKGSGD